MVLIPTTLVFIRVKHAAQDSDQGALHPRDYSARIRRDASFALNAATVRNSRFISGLNIPGTVIEILISLPTSWPSVWHPSSVLPDTWRALTYPLFCLPAWWLVGRGIDALLGRRRLNWATLLTGSLLSLVFLVCFVGLRVELSASDRAKGEWPLVGLALWTVLFGVLPAAWLRQMRFRERVSDEGKATP